MLNVYVSVVLTAEGATSVAVLEYRYTVSALVPGSPATPAAEVQPPLIYVRITESVVLK